MLRDGAPPPTFRKPPPPPVPMPISHFLARPRRRAAERTNAAIDASVRELAGVAARHSQEEAQQEKTSPSTLYLPWSRDTRRNLTRVSKVNVWAMSSLLGVW